MSLVTTQSSFAFAASLLIQQAFHMGYQVTLGDAFRDPRCPYGSETSKHPKRLAIDLNLFKDGVYLNSTDDHRRLGEWWEQSFGAAIWGGRFEDGNHYEWTADGNQKDLEYLG